MESQTQFGDRAEHTLGYFAAELAFFNFYVTGKMSAVGCNGNNCSFKYICSGGNNLNWFVSANIYLADNESFSVGMAGYLENFSAYNA